MNASFSKFVFFSFLIVCSLGAVKGNRVSSAASQTTEQATVESQVERLLQQGVVARTNRRQKNDSNKEDQFVFQFPNIFNVFRSLF
jgi:hypothetical protein